jgi:hypothetical protein
MAIYPLSQIVVPGMALEIRCMTTEMNIPHRDESESNN